MIRKYITGGKQPEQASIPSTGASTQSPSINTGNFYNSAIGQTANVFAQNLLPNMFGNSQFGNFAQGVMGSILESGAQSLLNKNSKFDFSNLNSSIAGYGAGLIGNGIESIGGHSKTAKFFGGASSSALGSLGSNLLNSGSLSIANPTAFGMQVVGAGLQSAIGPSKEYGGKYGAVTKTIDQIYDAATGVVGAANPIVGGAMVLNKGLSNLFGSTDGMTLQDAILGSAAMPAPVKWLNMAGAKKTGTFNNYSWQNQEDISGLLGSYGNIESRINKAMNEAGKTYGTFSRGAYKRARNNLAFANQAWDKLTAMADESELETIRSSKMDTVNTGRYAQSIQGGLQPYYRGKHGMKFPKLQSGGYITNLRSRISTIADNAKKRGRSLADLITYAEQVNPRFIQRLQEPELRFIPSKDGIKSHLLSYTTDGDKAYVFPMIQEGPFGDLFEIHDYKDAYERALKNGDYLVMTPSEAELFTTQYKTYKPWKDLIDSAENKYTDSLKSVKEMYDNQYEGFFKRVYKDGGIIKKKKRIKLVGEGFEKGEYIEVDSLDSDQKAGRKPIGKDKKGRDIFLNGDGEGVLNQNGRQASFKEGGAINSSDYDFMTGAQSFRKGGSMNIIPEGALHARKHHMADSEKLTQKGIPVVDNDGNQQAEIECNEIIFRKEVTDKIEKLRKEFEEASGSKKDEIAIQCGKLLTKEIINNTDDRTGLLKVVENDIT